jgi:hypothetical protein
MTQGAPNGMVTRKAELTLGSDHADPNRLALALRVVQPCLLGLFLSRERFRQRSEFTTDILEKQPSLDDFGHESL